MKHKKNIYFDDTALTQLNALYMLRFKKNKTTYSDLVAEGLKLLYKKEVESKEKPPYTAPSERGVIYFGKPEKKES